MQIQKGGIKRHHRAAHHQMNDRFGAQFDLPIGRQDIVKTCVPTPTLHFAHDDSVNRGFEMDALIRKAMSETRPEEN